MKVLDTGAAGQLDKALLQPEPRDLKLNPNNLSGYQGMLCLDSPHAEACRAAVRTHRPDLALNCGAQTAMGNIGSQQELTMAMDVGTPRTTQ